MPSDLKPPSGPGPGPVSDLTRFQLGLIVALVAAVAVLLVHRGGFGL